MENRRNPTPRLLQDFSAPPPSPTPNFTSSLFCDISNYKTPKPQSKSSSLAPSPSPAVYFTASRKTPSSAAAPVSTLRRRSHAPSSRSKAAGRLRALEIEQSKSSRKVQIRREKQLRSFAGAATAWLNFLFENPGTCGCESTDAQGACRHEETGSARRGKRPSLDGGAAFGISRAMRSPKRRRNLLWGAGDAGEMTTKTISATALAMLEVSLHDIVSLEDLKERMGAHLNQKSCNEVLSMMCRVTKSIDDGKLKMKSHCPIVTDVGMKKKALEIFLCYNSWWLCIGLNVVFGGDSLLLEGDNSADQMFLKMVSERLLLSHSGLAKAYSYNKLVEGVYRPGYYEALGAVILKRFLLLALFLDKAKSESSIPLKYGIDGIDGGSPLLFCRQNPIKSTRKLIHEFLADAMHGEGDLHAHLSMLGYKVIYEQSPLAEYHFHVTNIFDDLQDGILLCRAIQLLQHDSSILLKVVVPSDTHKKSLQNCRLVMHFLEQAEVPLTDKDGTLVLAEDITNGDEELVLSLIWNLFIHLQLPLLLDRTLLLSEIAKLQGSDVDDLKCKDASSIILLFKWIQAVCDIYQIEVDTCASKVDGKALCCLVDHYLKKGFLHCSVRKEQKTIILGERSTNPISVKSDIAQDLLFIQRVTTIIGNFPEVLLIDSILTEDSFYDERCLVILLTFLASVLLNHKGHIDVGDLARVSQCPQVNVIESNLSRSERHLHIYNGTRALLFDSPLKQSTLDRTKEWAACLLQLHFRGFILRKKFLKIKAATTFLQNITRLWLSFSKKQSSHYLNIASESECRYHGYLRYMTDRHRFIRIKKSVRLIQQAVRAWIKSNDQSDNARTSEAISTSTSISNKQIRCDFLLLHQNFQHLTEEMADLEIESKAAKIIQQSWRKFLFEMSAKKTVSAITIQSFWRSLTKRREYLALREAALKIQCCFHSQHSEKVFCLQREAAIVIQQIIRGQVARRKLLGCSILQTFDPIDSRCKTVELRKVMHSVLALQRGWRQVLLNRLWNESSIIIQAHIRQQNAQKEVSNKLRSLHIIQRWWRRTLFLRVREASAVTIQSYFRGWVARKQTYQERNHIILIQRWWRRTLFHLVRTASVLTIQSYFRGWVARKQTYQERNRIILIQSYWKGWLVRKSSKPQISDIRCKIKKALLNVDDDMRIINRLLAALSELLDRKKMSNIRQTCATLDMATEHSQICCEKLVSAGVLNILCIEIQLLNRSVPDQEILKHILSTLRNIARYPHLASQLINTPASVKTIFHEVLRNKGEGYYIACELLAKLMKTTDGPEAINCLASHARRLGTLVQELISKLDKQKRHANLDAARGVTEQRLRAASNLFKLIKDNKR